MQFIDLQAQYARLQHNIDARIRQVLSHGQYIDGPEVRELQTRLQEYIGVTHAVTCANGTDAIQLGLTAMGSAMAMRFFVQPLPFLPRRKRFQLVVRFQ